MICKQGNVDGLCGLYALVNFISNKVQLADDDYTTGREAFRYLVESAEALGHLTAHRMHDGFEWPLLKEIFNHWAERYEQPYQAYSLSRVTSLERNPSSNSVIQTIVNADGGVVLSVKRGRHWVLVMTGRRDDGRFEVIDADSRYPEEPRKKFDDIRCGVALISKNSNLKKVLDAQAL